MAAQGIQVFIATHSLFLLREFEIVLAGRGGKNAVPARYFGLGVEGQAVTLLQSSDVNGIGAIASLEESLAQSDRYMDL